MTVPATDLDLELAIEQAHLIASRAALRRMRERAEALFATGEDVAGDAYSAETLGRTLARRVAALADDPSTPLFFGRLDFGPAAAGGAPTDSPSAIANTAAGEHADRYHIGRRHVTDDAGEPMVLDWRAPVSRAFYRASARDPQGVTVRRRFGFSVASERSSAEGSDHSRSGASGAAHGGPGAVTSDAVGIAARLTSFEDEHLDRGEELGTRSRILTTEIERPRVGPMRDIVATIQPDQDELVGAELDESICVQGAPGTGKTAVGLHRAAYLLYHHRERLRRSGVLILGPNRAFLRYISAVLPALGEIDVQQTTVDDLVDRVAARGADSAEAAAVKHDARMADVLRAALYSRIRKPTEPLVAPDGSYRWRVGQETLRRIIDDVRRERPPYGIGRERVRARVVALLQRQSEARRGDSPGEAWLRRMARSRPVTTFLDACWPAVVPEQLVFDLFSDPASLARAADGILTGAEQAALAWPDTPRSVRSARWTAADAVLVDEAAGLIDRSPSFGHVVIDEAQDLSPMQCRAIARRSEHGSVTLLGDLAQGTSPWAATDWRSTLSHLGKPEAAVVPLTTGFRVPAVVLALANRLLPALAVDVPPATSLRRDGGLDLRPVAGDLAAAVAQATRDALAHEGSVAVIAADAAVPGLAKALEGLPVGGPEDDARVTLLPASLAKGLEYDHVIVVEPADIAAAEPRGLHRLYVVLTRAVSRLAVVHAAPLPVPLRS